MPGVLAPESMHRLIFQTVATNSCLQNMGCWDYGTRIGDRRIRAMINKISNLIDWDECPALKRYMDWARRHQE